MAVLPIGLISPSTDRRTVLAIRTTSPWMSSKGWPVSPAGLGYLSIHSPTFRPCAPPKNAVSGQTLGPDRRHGRLDVQLHTGESRRRRLGSPGWRPPRRVANRGVEQSAPRQPHEHLTVWFNEPRRPLCSPVESGRVGGRSYDPRGVCSSARQGSRVP